ncbi:MAG TPA: SIS domain-containing protein [Candidatus Paceibacterota bacterium]|nr:SIS domain-containing protein [Candidatus Paceibacterota bacterium]
MDMQEQITRMLGQFSWEPMLERVDVRAAPPRKIIVCGMGGSHLAAELLARAAPGPAFLIHHDYGLPPLSNTDKNGALILISSYSGETEEALSAFDAAQSAGVSMAVMTSGGRLLEEARTAALPTVVLPREDIEPRMTLGYMLRGLAGLLGDASLAARIAAVAQAVHNDRARTTGEALANALAGGVPVLYASSHNASLAYILKATFNETAKIPAFWGTVPEVCHNELSGYDFGASFAPVATQLRPIFITDTADHPRVQVRIALMRTLLEERGVATSSIEVSADNTSLAAGMQAILIGTWAAVLLAAQYEVPNAKTPLIATFKEQLVRTPT